MGQTGAGQTECDYHNNRPPNPRSLANLKRDAGPGRPKGSKNRSTIVLHALADAKLKVSDYPRKIRDECMDIIATEELIYTLATARKEETKVALIREGFDRSRGKPPVSVDMASHSSQITGTLVDLLALLRSPGEQKAIPESIQSDGGIIEADSLQDADLKSPESDKKMNP